MTVLSPDCELVSDYAANGSETAFRSLVSRHADLVYATALRQVGDHGMAEEITQNVFVTLARKAPRLAGVETLAGWLHRSAILESKARIRAELRRRRRENAAAELATIQSQGTLANSELVPLLDEALLNIRDSDRLALILRFWEDRSLRDIGSALGVDEDAARKRVSRALDRITEFFRRRGLAIPSGSAGAILMANAAKAAPAGLALSAANAGLAAGGSATGLNLVLFQLMTLTKTQTAVLCAVVAAAPLVWQWHASTHSGREQERITAELNAANRKATELEEESRRLRDATIQAQADTMNTEIRLNALHSQIQGRGPRPVYRWDDNSPFVRVPKKFLERISIPAVTNKRGHLSEQIKEALQLTDSETQNTQAAIDRFLVGYHAAQAQKMRVVQPTDRDLMQHTREETRVFEVPHIGERLGELRQTLFGELESTMDLERSQRLRSALGDWMPLDDQSHGLNTGMAVLNFDHRVRFYQPKPGDPGLFWGITGEKGQMSATMALEEIPGIFRDYLQDWITLAQSQPPQK
jgi:RNA polymerase sigma factor (sigma-70 family)